MKALKKVVALMLCLVMTAGIFAVSGITVDDIANLFKAEAAITIGGITQQRVVSNYESLYRSYQKRFFEGEETNWPTNFVIPGLGSSDDYTPQGMTYWKAKEWILISAYDASGNGKNSVIYALDAVSTNLVAVFKIQNADGSANTSHGGGIAASEYNFYYADSASKVSYVPLSEMDISGGEKTIKLKDSVDFAKEMTGVETGQTVKTSYCCYDDGILWTGNFVWSGDDDYKAVYHATYQSILLGYKLAGNSSEEEWYYLKNGYNLVKLNTDSTTTEQTSGTAVFKSYNIDGANAEIHGKIVTDTALGESTVNFATVNLVEGTKYKFEFIADNNLSDMYMFSPGGKHCNVKQSQDSTITSLGNGKYHYQMIFTAGVKPTGADSSWQASGVDDGTNYTGTYTIRFDQDNVPAGGRTFNITDFSITEYVETQGFTPNSKYEGIGCAGNPTHVVALDTDRIQYAMVDKGKLYVSRSWARTQSGNHTRELMIADIDLNRPGDTSYTVNGRLHNIYLVNYDDASVTHFGGNYKSSDKGVSAEELNRMLWMGEALCVIDDYLYMFGEGAAWNYNGKASDNVCGEPIDVIWKIDQYAIQGLTRSHDDVASVEYEKVTSLSDINSLDEYIVLYESAFKDPVTQRNILYLLDANGGYGDKKLSKKADSSNVTAASTGDSRGIVGYEIRDYSVDGTKLILSAEDDANKSLHWQFESGTSTSLKLRNRDLYFAKHPYLYVGDSLFAMTTTASSTMKIKDWGNGSFTLYGNGTNYSIWCNDGSVPESITAYTNFYSNHSQSGFAPNYHNLEEIPGTFHITNSNQPALPTGEQQGMLIYKRVTDPYTSSYETQVVTDLKANLTADGTYDIVLETYATNALQYQRTQERPTDFIFVVDSSGSMDATDAYGYNTDTGWSALKQRQICVQYTEGDADDTVGDSHFGKGSNYDKVHASPFFYKLPDAEYGRICFAFNGLDSGNPTYGRDLWMWVEHPITGRCYRLSKLGFLTKGMFSGDAADNDRNNRLAEADYLANPQNYGWANRDAVMADVVANKNRTDYLSDSYSKWGSTAKRAGYEVLEARYTDDNGVERMTYYSYGNTQRLNVVKNAVEKLTFKIADEASRTGLDHRIALVTFASDGRDSNYNWTHTGMYTNDSTTMKQYTGSGSISAANYQKAFFNTSQFALARSIINGFDDLGHTFVQHGLQMASDIINNQATLGNTYDVNGNRSAVVVVLTDGMAGGDNKNYANITNSNEAANGAIGGGALNLKRNGAYIFTVQVGSAGGDYKVSGFEEDTYMKYLSSKYTGAKSMTDPGPMNTKEYEYFLEIPAGTDFNVDKIVDSVFNSVTSNSQNSISYLTTTAVLRERLTDAFDLTNATISYQTAKSKYDGIGRLYFEEPKTVSGYTTTFDKTTNNIEVSGFDYSDKNVSEYNSNLGKGEKLIVTISGVIADADAELLNTSINDTTYTALYENSTYKNSNQPVKAFPTYHFSIPEYTYYMDYDIPMYDSDINGTLCSVDSTLQKQSTYKNELETGNMGIEFVNGNQDMIYTLNSQAGLTEKLSKGYVLIKRDDGTYDWFRLNIVPASTVYYEENKMDTLDGTQSFTEWTQNGSFAGKYQSLSGENDVFGSDETYYNSTDKFSLGTSKQVTVTSANNRSDTQTFTFTGTGFDLISACGANTGIQTVTVKKHQTDGTMKIVKVFMVDTYYNDATYKEVAQVPVVQFKSDYGTYTVETTAAYYSFAGGLKTQSLSTQSIDGTEIEATSAIAPVPTTDELFAQVGMDELIGQEVEVIWMDDNSIFNGGTGAETATLSTQAGLDSSSTTPSLVNYIDGFRIYNPIDYNDEYVESEKNASYYSVIETITAGGMGGDSFVGYLEGGATGSDFANYLTSGGPKYEVYLNNGKSLAFRFKADSTNARAMISLRAASGSAKAKIGGAEFNVTNACETYFDITDYITSSNGIYTVTITNTGSGLLAVDNIKITNAALVPLNGVSLTELNELISTQAVEIDPHAPKSATYTYVQAPADDPDIDPEGSIPTLEVVAENNKYISIIDTIKSFFARIFAYLKNAFQSFSFDWILNI